MLSTYDRYDREREIRDAGDGRVGQVRIGSPAYVAGMTSAGTFETVSGYPFSVEVAARAMDCLKGGPIELTGRRYNRNVAFSIDRVSVDPFADLMGNSKKADAISVIVFAKSGER